MATLTAANAVAAAGLMPVTVLEHNPNLPDFAYEQLMRRLRSKMWMMTNEPAREGCNRYDMVLNSLVGEQTDYLKVAGIKAVDQSKRPLPSASKRRRGRSFNAEPYSDFVLILRNLKTDKEVHVPVMLGDLLPRRSHATASTG